MPAFGFLMFVVAFNLVIGLFSSDAHAGRKLTACERALFSFTEADILKEANNLAAEVAFPIMSADRSNPHMRVFEEVLSRPKDKSQKTELTTARDYATFVRKSRGQTFVFVSQFQDVSIPVFDGLVLDEDGDPIYNVSLKFASTQMPVMKEDTLLTSLGQRLDLRRERRMTRTLLNWLTAVNNWQVPTNQPFFLENFDRDMMRGMTTAKVFGITDDKKSPYGRPLHLVVDMRSSGYTYDFVNRAELRERIQQTLQQYTQIYVTLSLLWNSEQVLEFTHR